MSGGVDSSVAASLLHEQGYDVVGVTLQLYDQNKIGPGAATAKTKTCCAGQDIHDARRVAEARGFPHYVLNYESNFRESVIDDFADSYIRGETPIPCVRCNQSVKFRDLLKVAHDLGADCMATGHYVQRKDGTSLSELHRAIDETKDQSYFLFATTQEQLDFLRFPLGGWTKDITRQHAERLGLLTADKPDSQDICFVPGIINFTIGQRKGLGIGGGHSDDNNPFYVLRIDPVKNEVVVGPKEALAKNVLYVKDCNWLLSDLVLSEATDLAVKFRSSMKPVPARIARNDNGAEITLDAPQYGISPGQAAVFYKGGRVLGGGWITGTGTI